MKILKILSISALLMAMISCSPVKVVVDVNKNTDFSNYKTYSFLGWQNNSDEILAENEKKVMREAFTREFERRGLGRVNNGGDMQISLYIVTSVETAVSGYNDYVGGGMGGYGAYNSYGTGWGYGYSGNTFKTQGKLVGTFIMTVYDGKSKDQVWQAVTTSTVIENPAKRDKTIPRKIAELMKRFPVQPK